MSTCIIGKSYPATQGWDNHQRLTNLLSASIRLEEAKRKLEALRETVRWQEAEVERLRNAEYTFRVIK